MAIKSNGTAFSFTENGKSAVAVGKLTTIGEINCDAALIDVTTLEDSCKRFVQGTRDAGEIRLTGFHFKDDQGQKALRSAYLTGETGTAQITFPDGVQAAFPALVRSHALGAAQVDGAIAFSCVLRANGAVTVTLP